MIKSNVINNAKIILGAALVFFLCWALEINFTVALFLLSLTAYLKLRRLKNVSLLNLTFLFALAFVPAYIIVRNGIYIFYLPLCVIPMLATLLFGQLELSLLITLASSLAVAAIPGNYLYLGLLFLAGGIFSSIFVFGSHRRIAIIRAGLLAGLVQALALFFMHNFWIAQPLRYLIPIINGLSCGIIVIGVLPVFEYLFKTVTDVSLLELADFNHPLLQRMMQEAPGTYHHSLVVGNLSDAACRSIGANALLSRIGAYYHDIGKLQKPDYFSENQEQDSKHDNLAPTMSKMIIMNHVKEGAELARKYKLSPHLIDFILCHHGNSLVYYFYRRALENLEEDQEVREEGFRYPGPKPNTKETAVVLLADSVEAACRALKDPVPATIEELVHKIINNKFIDGQLDECELTLKDLEKIASVFIRILSGIYHVRVTYPEGQSGESNHKKPAKEDSRQSEKDKKSNS